MYVGSVASRSLVSRNTLKIILQNKKQYIFFDPNIRVPNYNLPILKKLLFQSHFVKLTSNEFILLSKIMKTKINSKRLFKINKKLKYLFVTNGSRGSKIYTRKGLESHIRPNKRQKKLEYTVGSGDFFSAGLIHSISKGYSVKVMHKFAQNLSDKFLYKIGV